MSRTIRTHDGERYWTQYQEKGVNESVAINEFKRTLDACDGDGFRAARAFQQAQPALFKTLEASGKSFEELVELAAMMSGSHDLTGPGEWH